MNGKHLKDKNISKLNIASLVFLSLIFVICLVVLYMSTFPRTVWELTKQPETIGTEFKVGEHIPLKASYCKYKPVKGTMALSYVDGVIYTTPTFEGNLAVGCSTTTSYNPVVPNIPPGTYTLRVTFTHEPNAFRTITNTWVTNEFNIIE